MLDGKEHKNEGTQEPGSRGKRKYTKADQPERKEI